MVLEDQEDDAWDEMMKLAEGAQSPAKGASRGRATAGKQR